MGFWDWLFGEDEDEAPPEPLVQGAELKCQYGSQSCYLMVENRDIDINNLSQACVLDRRKNIDIMPFGNCKLGVECKEIMDLEERWENPEPQKTLANGEEIITTKSILICKRGGMEIKAVTSGQDGVAAGIFAKEYALRQEIEEKYPGLIALLEEPYESLYLNEGMYQTALQFLKDCIERHDGEIQLAVLYSGSGLEETLIRKVLGRLLPGCEESKPENYLGVLEEYGVATNMYDVPGWDPHLLNDQMLEMLKVSCAETAERIETSGFSRFPEEHREFMGWAGDTAMGMGYGLVLYYSMTEVQPKRRNTWLNKKISELKNAIKKAFSSEGGSNPKNPMTGDDWHNYFNETYGADKVTWESASIQDIVDMPSKITDFSPKQISDLATKNGWTVEPLGKGSLAGIPYEQGGGLSMHAPNGSSVYIQYHPGGGHHGEMPYYKVSSGENGIVRYYINGERAK